MVEAEASNGRRLVTVIERLVAVTGDAPAEMTTPPSSWKVTGSVTEALA